MSKQLFLPESMYKIDSQMNYRKIKTFYKKKSTISAKVLRLNSKDKIFEVDLGGDQKAIMPLEEATIYNMYKEDGLYSYSILSLVGKIIQAKIIDVENGVVLSRKSNMLEALEYFKQRDEVCTANITGFSHLSAFVDIGAGISGKCYPSGISKVVFTDIKDLGFKKGNIIQVKILDFKEDINCFDLSFVDAVPDIKNSFNEGDVIMCKVFSSLNDGIGYYVLIDNRYAGIIDSPYVELNYGDEVSAVIHKITDKGPKLRLVEKL